MAYVSKVDTTKTVRYIRDISGKHFPFIAASSLTMLARDSQADIQRNMESHFTLRSSRRLKRGVRIEPAKKKDRGNMRAYVKDIDEFMWLHVWGGTKKATKSKYVSVPGEDLLDKSPRTSTGRMKKRWTPKSLIAKSKQRRARGKSGRRKKATPFVFQASHGRYVMAIRRGPDRFPLEFLYGWPDSVTIDKRWPFPEEVHHIVKDRASRAFIRQWTKAMRTAR